MTVVAPAGAARRTIPVAGPWITDHEIAAVADATAHAWYDGATGYVTRFEQAFADRCVRRHAIALPSCTSGLHLALAALGVGLGDEVVVSESTWIASAAPVRYVGATPVFADVDPATWCVTPASITARLTERTKAVIAVDLYGGTPEWDALLAACASRGVAVVEDAAQAIGSTWHGRPAGSFGAASVFSFHGSKTLTTGEGGMVLTDDDELHARMLFLRDHGRNPGDTSFFQHEVAFKYRMSPVLAALGGAQLDRLDELVGRKRQLFAWYRERLADVPGLVLNVEPERTTNAVWMTTVVLDADLGWDKARLGTALADRGIATRPFFHPLSSMPAFAEWSADRGYEHSNPVAYSLGARGINLPSALCLDEHDVDTVSTELREILGC
jgi:perosamine synthetase